MADESGKPPAGYLYLREELRFERQWLGSRMTYYMTSQSFLLTTAVIARAVDWNGAYWFSGVLVSLVGIAASAVRLNSIHAAYERMDRWREGEAVRGEAPRRQALQEPDVRDPHALAACERVWRACGADPRVPAAGRWDVITASPA